ncbi:hypothetical protein, partial [Bifidobacterium longum]|uniref:hypothetical protein n=1 Tax=Bifidobacterium longum TaxID=216816 RepID=UPI001E502C09
MTRRFEGTARLVYCLLLLQKALRLRARTVYRTVAGSSPAAGAIESLGSPRLFYFHRIGDQTRHPIINREIQAYRNFCGALDWFSLSVGGVGVSRGGVEFVPV